MYYLCPKKHSYCMDWLVALTEIAEIFFVWVFSLSKKRCLAKCHARVMPWSSSQLVVLAYNDSMSHQLLIETVVVSNGQPFQRCFNKLFPERKCLSSESKQLFPGYNRLFNPAHSVKGRVCWHCVTSLRNEHANWNVTVTSSLTCQLDGLWIGEITELIA